VPDVPDTTTERLLTRQAVVETRLDILAKGMDELKATIEKETAKLQASFQSAGKDNFDRLVQIVEAKEKVQAERDKAKVEADAKESAENKKARERTQWIWAVGVILLFILINSGKVLETLKALIK
jgi:hypothetical protein